MYIHSGPSAPSLLQPLVYSSEFTLCFVYLFFFPSFLLPVFHRIPSKASQPACLPHTVFLEGNCHISCFSCIKLAAPLSLSPRSRVPVGRRVRADPTRGPGRAELVSVYSNCYRFLLGRGLNHGETVSPLKFLRRPAFSHLSCTDNDTALRSFATNERSFPCELMCYNHILRGDRTRRGSKRENP